MRGVMMMMSLFGAWRGEMREEVVSSREGKSVVITITFIYFY